MGRSQIYNIGNLELTDWPLFIDGLADDIDDASKSLLSYWHLHANGANIALQPKHVPIQLHLSGRSGPPEEVRCPVTISPDIGEPLKSDSLDRNHHIGIIVWQLVQALSH